MTTDLPYLEELVIHLKNDEGVKKAFPGIGSVKVFVNPDEIKELKKSDCPYKEAIWIFPGQIRRKASSNRLCPVAVHTFGLVILKKVNGKHFEWSQGGEGELNLDGDYIDLAKSRRVVKDAMKCFSPDSLIELDWQSTNAAKMIDCWLASTIEYRVEYSL